MATLPLMSLAAHGTRARYVSGCRCEPCRTANRLARRETEDRALRAALQYQPAEPPSVQIQSWTTPSGQTSFRTYRRACPGVNGQPCKWHSHLRKDSTGGICGNCRLQLIWNGLVDARPVRRHLRYLSRHNVGQRSVSAACGVGKTTIQKILSGAKRVVRKDTADRLLSVSIQAVADGALVPGERTHRLLAEILALGYTKSDIARRLGYKVLALQTMKGEYVLAKSALKVAKLHRAITSGRAGPPVVAAIQRRAEEALACGALRQTEIANEFAAAQSREYFTDGFSFWRLPRLVNDDIKQLERRVRSRRRTCPSTASTSATAPPDPSASPPSSEPTPQKTPCDC